MPASKPGRNDPCHCGSGKKYKRCHLPEDEAEARLRASLGSGLHALADRGLARLRADDAPGVLTGDELLHLIAAAGTALHAAPGAEPRERARVVVGALEAALDEPFLAGILARLTAPDDAERELFAELHAAFTVTPVSAALSLLNGAAAYVLRDDAEEPLAAAALAPDAPGPALDAYAAWLRGAGHGAAADRVAAAAARLPLAYAALGRNAQVPASP